MSEWTKRCCKCNSIIRISGEDLPKHSCDDVEVECEECGAKHLLGWYAEITFEEIKDRKSTNRSEL